MRVRILVLSAIALWIVGMAAPAIAQQGGNNQTLITRVVADNSVGQIVILGHSFCDSPTVHLAGDALPVLTAASGGPIIATMPPIEDGDYLLTVDCNRGENGIDRWNLTVGGTASGGGGLPAPDFDSGWLSRPNGDLVLIHGLNVDPDDLLVDVTVGGPANPASFWGINQASPFVHANSNPFWRKLDANTIVVNAFTTIRIRIWIVASDE